jgi:hypothetical protein
MLEEPDGAEAVRRLLDLPFVDASPHGLVVHERVRDAVAGFLSGANPVRYRHLRRRAWRELRNEVREAGPAELWRYTADMLYLIDNPIVREAFFPSGTQPLAVEPAVDEDQGAVSAIARRHDGPEAAAILERWWDEAPETFFVARDRDGLVTGCFSLLESATLRPSLARGDPVVEAWARDLREHRPAKGDLALGLRRCLLAGREADVHGAAAAAGAYVRRRPRRPDLLADRRATRLSPASRRRRGARRRRVHERRARLRSRVRRRLAGQARGGRARRGRGAGARRAGEGACRAGRADLADAPRARAFCAISASARAGPSRGPSSSPTCGEHRSPAAATSSTPSCGRSGASSGRPRRSWRPFAEADIACAPIGARIWASVRPTAW